VTEDNDLMLITDQGKIIRNRITDTRVIGRNTQGVRLMVTEENERIVAVAKLAERDDDETDREAEETAALGGIEPEGEEA
jgi:DNA gyrase subunit A